MSIVAHASTKILRRLLLVLGILGLVSGIGTFGYFIFRPQQIPDGGSLAVSAKKSADQRSVALSAPEFSEATLCQPRISFDFSTDAYAVTRKSTQFGSITTRTAGFEVKAQLVVADAAGAVLHSQALTLGDDNTSLQQMPSGQQYDKTTDPRTGREVLVGKASYKLNTFRAPPRARLTVKLELPEDAPRDDSKPPEEQFKSVGTIGELELQLYRDVADVEAYRKLNVEAPTWGLYLAGGSLLLLIAGVAIGARGR
jgi:hypothetical protein